MATATVSTPHSTPSSGTSTLPRPTSAPLLFLLALAAMAALDLGLLALLAGALSHIGGLLGAELAVRGQVRDSLRTLGIWTLAALPLLFSMVRSWRLALRAPGPGRYLALRLGADLLLFAGGGAGFFLLFATKPSRWMSEDPMYAMTEMGFVALTGFAHLLASALPLLLITASWPKRSR